KLAYLLQHRGYTHTAVFALPIGLALGLICARPARVRGRELARVLGVGAGAALLHVAFDALNNYGVHPVIPQDNRGYYGDALFIIEPLLLAALLPLLACARDSRSLRALGTGLSVLLLVLVFWRAFVPLSVAFITSAALVLAFALQLRMRSSPWPAL